MNIKKISLYALLLTGISHQPVFAQNVTPSDATSPTNSIPINASCGGSASLRSLNLDMVDINSNFTNTTPSCVWGNGGGNYFWAASHTGATCGGNNYSGITANNNFMSSNKFQKLPWSQSSISSQQVEYADVAVGVFDDQSPNGTGTTRYFVLAVYESNGEIYLDHYNYDVDYGGVTTSLDVDQASFIICPTVGPCYTSTAYFTNNGRQLSNNAAGTASRPHIDLIYDEHDLAAGRSHLAVGYVITWQQGTPGMEEVWGIDGPISTSGQNNPPTPNPNFDFKIDDGKFPDVAGVTAAYTLATGSPVPTKGYVTYLSRNGDEVKLADWEYNATPTPVITLHGTISATTIGFDEFQYPRIAAPQYFDYTIPGPPNEPVCVVAVSENDGGSNYKINTYAYHDPAGTPFVNAMVDASDYMGNGFNSAGKQAIKPVITGVGSTIAGFYPTPGLAYDTYPTMFYSDHTHAVNNVTYAASGDFYAFGTDVASVSPQVLLNGTNYYETNNSAADLQVTTPFSYTGTEPQLAIATCNNSGYDLMTAYWDGSWIYRRYTSGGTFNNPYSFKPGKTTSIEKTGKPGYAVYPNPVKDRLNITNADGAAYTVTDVTGRSISTGILSGSKAGVDASSLVPGMYILHISKDGHTEQVKFVKQ